MCSQITSLLRSDKSSWRTGLTFVNRAKAGSSKGTKNYFRFLKNWKSEHYSAQTFLFNLEVSFIFLTFPDCDEGRLSWRAVGCDLVMRVSSH